MLKSDKWIKNKCQQYALKVTKIEAQAIGFDDIYTIDEFIAKCEDTHYLSDIFYDKLYHIFSEGEDSVKTMNNAKYHIEDLIKDFKERKYFKVALINLSTSVMIEKIKNPKSMIEPFVPESIKTDEKGNKIPSYGLSSYGYDIRLGRNIKLFKNKHDNSSSSLEFPIDRGEQYVCSDGSEFVVKSDTKGIVIDACDFNSNCYVEFNDVDEFVIPPHGFILGHTVEKFTMPPDTMAICIGKSTHARTGIHILVTPLEPGWSGYLTLEISNLTGLPIRLKTGTGIAQLNFHQSEEQCETSYADRGGKYQNQDMIPVDPKV